MPRLKICSKCAKAKEPMKDFYLCSGKWRAECKVCTIKRNCRYQRETEAWKHRYPDDETRNKYCREYYAKNKERFAQYRKEFAERHPGYYQEYYERRRREAAGE